MEKVNYDNFAGTFSSSREWMKWEEIEYFLEKYTEEIDGKKILDVWCGNGRLLEHFLKSQFINDIDYFWIDSSAWMISEAKKKFWSEDFSVLDMLDLDKIPPPPSLPLAGEELNSPPARGELEGGLFESVFFIASFHHLLNLEERLRVLKNLKKIVIPWSYIFMTNWALESELNKEKYEKSFIKNSQNEFWSKDFSIKIWEFERFYHSFSLDELEYLFKESWYEIIENRLFENDRNFVSIIKA